MPFKKHFQKKIPESNIQNIRIEMNNRSDHANNEVKKIIMEDKMKVQGTEGCNWKNGSDMLDSKVCTRNY